MEELLLTLQALIPVLGQATGHGEIAQLAERLIAIGEQQIRLRAGRTGETREEILADAAKTWDEAVQGADELLRMGHDGEDPPAPESPDNEEQ